MDTAVRTYWEARFAVRPSSSSTRRDWPAFAHTATSELGALASEVVKAERRRMVTQVLAQVGQGEIDKAVAG